VIFLLNTLTIFLVTGVNGTGNEVGSSGASVTGVVDGNGLVKR